MCTVHTSSRAAAPRAVAKATSVFGWESISGSTLLASFILNESARALNYDTLSPGDFRHPLDAKLKSTGIYPHEVSTFSVKLRRVILINCHLSRASR